MSTETPDLPDLRERLDRAADAPSFRAVDLDAVVGRGSRLRARRRMASGVAVLAALGVIGAGLGLAVESRPEASRDLEPAGTSTAPAPASDVPLAWARDGVVHLGDRTLRPAHGVDVFLQTADRLVMLGTDGRVRGIDPGDQRGEETLLDPTAPPIGDRFRPRLVTDGSWVGWVSAARTGDVQAHFVDLGGQGESGSFSLPESGSATTSPLVSISDGTAYLRGTDGVTPLRLDGPMTGQAAPLPSTPGSWIVDIRGGTVIRSADDGTTVQRGDSPPQALTHRGMPIQQSSGTLSPNGEAWAPDQDTITVVRTTGDVGADLTPDIGSRYAYFSTVYRWLDDSTVAVIAAEAEQGPYALLRCDVPSRACRTEVELGSPDGLVLPAGERIG